MIRFVEAKLVSYNKIKVCIANPNKDNFYSFQLVSENFSYPIKPSNISRNGMTYMYEFLFNNELTLGQEYHVVISDLGTYVLNVNDLALLPDFDKKYAYFGNDLGVMANNKVANFALWAPLASSVILVIDEHEYHLMERDAKGVYRLRLNKNLIGHSYVYLVTNSGVTNRAVDPYAKASTANSRASVILDFNEFKINSNLQHLKPMHSPLDAIIYEGHVRDLTIDEHTNIVHKGKYLGLCEEKKTNEDGFSVGIDYIVSLGITHLQLLPIYDFGSVDELNPSRSYNWGYDPVQYFVPEGSYASDAKDPKSRINDVLTLISKFHRRGVRIVMDVVFNHLYNHQTSSLEAVVPNYYFRKTKDGKFFNASGCGNDIMSEHLMARKLIVDACKWWASFYHVDGFRFDLMGLIDVETMNQISNEMLKINKNFLLYGEGWNMLSGYNLKLANSDNYMMTPYLSYFNDYFRDVIIGDLYKGDCGFGLDNIVYRERFKEIFTGSSFNFIGYGSKFNNATRSLNFVECHDNNTLFDKIKIQRPNDSTTDILKRVSFVNGLVLLSFGIPFIHAGQEIGLTKYGEDNTYNLGDKYNFFNYSLLKKRSVMLDAFKYFVAWRKNIQLYHEPNIKLNKQKINIQDISNGGLCVTFYSYLNNQKRNAEIKFLFNPSTLPLIYNDRSITNIKPMSIGVLKDYL